MPCMQPVESLRAFAYLYSIGPLTCSWAGLIARLTPLPVGACLQIL